MCRNPKRCGKCWQFGHVGLQCKQSVVQGAITRGAPRGTVAPVKRVAPRGEPEFDDLLTEGYPYRAPVMPEKRVHTVHCFIDRDEEYYTEMEKLQRRGVVLLAENGMPYDMSCDNVADLAVRTRLVSREEIRISTLPDSCFLITLPEGLAPETFIHATPKEAWDEGLSFQQWSPHYGASISIPEYKVLVSLRGLPPHLMREKVVVNAVSKFGVFLGTVEQENPANLAAWWAVVGVDDLQYVPEYVTVHDGGMLRKAWVDPIKYKKVSLYAAGDLPPVPPRYRGPRPPPESPTPSPPGTDEERELNDDAVLVQLTRKTIREICRGKDPCMLPEEVRRIAVVRDAQGMEGEVSSQADRPGQLGGQHSMATQDPKGKAIALPQGSQDSTATKNQQGSAFQNPAKGSIAFRRQGANYARRISPIFVGPLGGAAGQNFGEGTQQSTQSHGNATANPGGVRILQRDSQLVGGTSPMNSQQTNEVLHATVQGSDHLTSIPTEACAGSQEGNCPSPKLPSTIAVAPQYITEVDPASSDGSSDPAASLAVLRKSVRLKRRRRAQTSAGPLRKHLKPRSPKIAAAQRKAQAHGPSCSARAEPTRTSCDLSPDGFFQVSVPYALCTDIAQMIGVNTEEVIRTIAEDNQERIRQPIDQPNDEVVVESEEEGEED